MGLSPFHVAVTVRDLTEAREFYGGLLGCPEGRSDTGWIDFNFYGHQFVCHRAVADSEQQMPESNVDGRSVPVPHYGVVLDWQEWEKLANRLASTAPRRCFRRAICGPWSRSLRL